MVTSSTETLRAETRLLRAEIEQTGEALLAAWSRVEAALSEASQAADRTAQRWSDAQRLVLAGLPLAVFALAVASVSSVWIAVVSAAVLVVEAITAYMQRRARRVFEQAAKASKDVYPEAL